MLKLDVEVFFYVLSDIRPFWSISGVILWSLSLFDREHLVVKTMWSVEIKLIWPSSSAALQYVTDEHQTVNTYWKAETYLLLWAPPISQSQGEHLNAEFPKPQKPSCQKTDGNITAISLFSDWICVCTECGRSVTWILVSIHPPLKPPLLKECDVYHNVCHNVSHNEGNTGQKTLFLIRLNWLSTSVVSIIIPTVCLVLKQLL